MLMYYIKLVRVHIMSYCVILTYHAFHPYLSSDVLSRLVTFRCDHLVVLEHRRQIIAGHKCLINSLIRVIFLSNLALVRFWCILSVYSKKTRSGCQCGFLSFVKKQLSSNFEILIDDKHEYAIYFLKCLFIYHQ